jgi:outer membrane protein with beta-barrel domain
LRKLAFLAAISALFVFPNLVSAQQGDAMIGFGTIVAPSAATCSVFSSTCVGPEKGGLFTNISGDVIFHKRLGLGFDASWRTKQGVDNNEQLYRPILFDFNGVYQPRISRKFGADLMGGIGWQTTRFYGFQYTTSCLDFNACYTSNNHFLVDLGGGVRYYPWGHFFIRPEVHYYHILNNTDVFTNSNVIRVGASIGYTIGPD